MRFLKRNPPDVALEKVADVLFEEYGVEGDLTQFESERDQNMRVDTVEGSYLFKVCNADEDQAVIDLQIQALRHIERVDPAVPVPRTLPTLTGAATGPLVSPDGTRHTVRLMSFLDGVIAGSRPEFDTPTFRRNTGTTLARLDIALRGFFHPAARQDHPWDLSRVPRLLEYTRHIENESARRNVVSILERVRDHTLPACAGLRHQVIHQDAHTWNLVVDPGDPAEISGIIDFGDMVYGPLVSELAVAAYLGGRADPSPETLVDIVAGYDAVVPLERGDVEVLFDLVLGRMAMNLTIAEARAALFPEEASYDSEREGLSERIEDALEAASDVEASLRRVLGFPSHASDVSTSQLREDRVNSLGRHSPHFYAEPLHVAAAEGMWIHGADERRYLDFYNNVPSVGHTNPRVVNAISRQQATLNTNTRYLYSTVVEYAQRLAATLDHGLDVCLFVNSGSEANDVASQIAKHRTGADGLLTMTGAYHGMTEAVLEMSNEEFAPRSSDIATIPAPDDFRHAPMAPARAADEAESAIARIKEAGHELAGFFIDPAMTSSGIPNVPPGFIDAIAGVVRAHGGLVVSDEVQAGFGRTGVMWGHGRERFVPDVVTIGKPAGNGQPLGVVVTRREILDGFMEQTELFSTFGGNPVSCAAGLAVLDVIESEGLVANSAAVGKYLKDSLIRLAEKQNLIGDVRGSGLLVGLELVSDRDNKTPAGRETALLVELMREAGVLVGTAGRQRNTLKLRPPLIARPQHVDTFIEALDSSLSEVDRRQP
ncbi:MAG: aminotransferase class III-fold pyridoxal phosphate-dependent enzyme [Actinobacteria bacterium]|nr:aminotransferase class III-fold pyridoxal phosphate-dependent enzyme [Actinomycetota bacterium]